VVVATLALVASVVVPTDVVVSGLAGVVVSTPVVSTCVVPVVDAAVVPLLTVLCVVVSIALVVVAYVDVLSPVVININMFYYSLSALFVFYLD